MRKIFIGLICLALFFFFGCAQIERVHLAVGAPEFEWGWEQGREGISTDSVNNGRDFVWESGGLILNLPENWSIVGDVDEHELLLTDGYQGCLFFSYDDESDLESQNIEKEFLYPPKGSMGYGDSMNVYFCEASEETMAIIDSVRFIKDERITQPTTCLDDTVSDKETEEEWVYGINFTLPPCWTSNGLSSVDRTETLLSTLRGDSIYSETEEVFINLSVEEASAYDENSSEGTLSMPLPNGKVLFIEISPGFENDPDVLSIISSI